ncbi:MAG: hypothetical protein NVS3B20_12340 [Polyangiales bacterium]
MFCHLPRMISQAERAQHSTKRAARRIGWAFARIVVALSVCGVGCAAAQTEIVPKPHRGKLGDAAADGLVELDETTGETENDEAPVSDTPPVDELDAVLGDSGGGETEGADAPSKESSLLDKKRVFVSSGHFEGNLKKVAGTSSGTAAGDKLCGEAAMTAALGGSWKAWLSSTKERAIDRLVDVGPWVLLDGTEVFASKAAIGKAPAVAINIDEFGKSADPKVWTGTKADMSLGNECYDWTSSSIFSIGLYGSSTFASSGWTEAGGFGCGAQYSLYCFEQ